MNLENYNISRGLGAIGNGTFWGDGQWDEE